jgi:hypothetical protein
VADRPKRLALYLRLQSRGAYTSRSLSGLIAQCGLIEIGAPLSGLSFTIAIAAAAQQE